MSTVYAPGLKYTMLPDAWVEAFSLNEGRMRAGAVAVRDGGRRLVRGARRPRRGSSGCASPRICATTGSTTSSRKTSIASGEFDAPFAAGTRAAVEVRAGSARASRGGARTPGAARARRLLLRHRRRRRAGSRRASSRAGAGAPLDLIVAEMMILANSTWGGWLAERKVAGIYRSQSLGRVRMSTTPAPHEGIGVDHYAWSTSPLRRYVDLVNQRQLIAAARGESAAVPAEGRGSLQHRLRLRSAVRRVRRLPAAHGALLGLALAAPGAASTRISASVIKGDVLRVDGMPFITRLAGPARAAARTAPRARRARHERDRSRRSRRACIRCSPRRPRSTSRTTRSPKRKSRRKVKEGRNSRSSGGESAATEPAPAADVRGTSEAVG